VVILDEYLDILQRKIILKENVEELKNQNVRKGNRSKIRGLLMRAL
jgi:hypothetical protein